MLGLGAVRADLTFSRLCAESETSTFQARSGIVHDLKSDVECALRALPVCTRRSPVTWEVRLPSMQRLALGVAFGLLVTLSLAQKSVAQIWPQRTVKFVVTLGPGSGVDIGTRLVAERLGRRWGQPVVVENRPGGDGLVAISAFVGANDDHVLLAAPSGSFTAHPFTYKNLPYKPADLLPIARVSNTIVVMATPASLEVKSLAELVAMARAQPGKLNWAGTTSSNEFLFAAFLKNAGLSMSKVPYRNLVDAANDVASARIQLNVTAFAIARPQLQAGKIKLLAITNTARASVLPDVPTVREAGFPELALDGLVGFFGPPQMPDRIREGIAADVREAMDSAVEERLNLTGQVPNFGGPTAFAADIEQQRARLAGAAKDLVTVPTE
jgi:tripartite-type tricarboxylate transporter receptor subunit TctC